MTDMATNILLVRRLNDALFRDDRRDEIVRRHVERRIENLDPLGRQGPAEYMGNLLGIALLDGDLFSRRAIEVDGRGRPGDVKGNAMPLSQHSNSVRADLVGDVAVGGHPVAAYDDGIDLARLHQITGHAVGNQRRGNPLLLKLPGGQPGALQKRTGLLADNGTT